MRTRLALVLSSVLFALSPTADARVLVQEDFESGDFPSAWSFLATVPVTWRVTQPGDCGEPSGVLAYNRGAACSYWHSFTTAGVMDTPDLQLKAGQPLRVECRLALEIDLGPDVFDLRLESNSDQVPPVILADETTIPNDGVMRDYVFLVDDTSAFLGHPANLRLSISADNLGNQGIGLLFDDVVVSLDPVAVVTCVGDNSGAQCPCNNPGGADEGCANSTGQGASLSTEGSSLVASDDLVLRASGARPNTTGIFLQGDAEIALPFRDGILCVGGATERLEVVSFDAAGEGATTGSLVTGGQVAPGDVRLYQLWYRDPAISPCGSGSNFSSALSVTWF